MPSTGDYGFAWGPMAVDRSIHVEGKGRVVSIAPTNETTATWKHWTELQVFMSEGGRRLRVHRVWIERKPDGRLMVTKTEELETNP